MGNSRIEREVWPDILRVAACFMVMLVHSTEPFYIGGAGSLVLSGTDALWVALADSFARACVPLFVVLSSYLLLPLRYSTGEFFKRRAARLLVPFLIWTCVYALVWGEPVQNFKDLAFNFNFAAGHLWFVYMLLGVYLIMPVISPWAEKADRKEILAYMAICFATYFIPFIRGAKIGETVVLYGTGGIPMQADFPLWGEACWNKFGLFYYVSGFMGYVLLGLYLRRFGIRMSGKKALAAGLLCFLCGFAICSHGVYRRIMASAGGVFPFESDPAASVGWETTLTYCSAGVALMVVGWILLFHKAGSESPFYRNVIQPVSEASYGMYLCHMLILAAFSKVFRNMLGLGADGILGIWTTPVIIILTAICTFACSALCCIAVKRIPKVGRWIVG